MEVGHQCLLHAASEGPPIHTKHQTRPASSMSCSSNGIGQSKEQGFSQATKHHSDLYRLNQMQAVQACLTCVAGT